MKEAEKYRGKRSDGAGWVKGYLVDSHLIRSELKSQSLKCIEGSVFKYECNVFDVIPETVGRFTGLTDKNGKGIYEGDIIDDGKGGLGLVIWVESIAQFSVRVGNDLFMLNEGNPTRALQLQYTERIGNIHDNPDLIETF